MTSSIGSRRTRAGRTRAGQSGTLRVAERVVEKIAALAAVDVEGVAGPPPRTATLGGSRLSRSRPRRGRPDVSAHVEDGTVRMSVTLSVVYPASVRETAEAVRDRVRERVAALAGLRVTQIDIDVPALRPPPRH